MRCSSSKASLANLRKLVQAGDMLCEAASYAAIIADSFELVSAVADGDWSKALSAGKDLAIDAAPLLLGAEVTGPLTVVVLVVQAELEAILRSPPGSSAICRDELVRLAALDFVEQCNVVAFKLARSLVANCKLMIDASRPSSVQDVAARQADREAAIPSPRRYPRSSRRFCATRRRRTPSAAIRKSSRRSAGKRSRR